MYKKLSKIQSELKAPKSQFNNFGKYNYRNCEDILEAVKPLLAKEELVLNITDEIVLIGDRYYVKATATIYDGNNKIETSAFAREADNKKGMDESQVTGAASSYARKYALNGLFCIDDTKDADTANKQDNIQDKADNKTTSAQIFDELENGSDRPIDEAEKKMLKEKIGSKDFNILMAKHQTKIPKTIFIELMKGQAA